MWTDSAYSHSTSVWTYSFKKVSSFVIFVAGSPSSALLPFLCLGEGSPTKIDYRKKLVPLF